MKKISSKIIIFLSLTLVLWGGVNLAYAQDATDCAGKTGDAYKACLKSTMTAANAVRESTAATAESWDALYKGVEGIGNLANGILKTVLVVIAGIFQYAIIPVLGVLVKLVAMCLDTALLFTLDSDNIKGVQKAIGNTWSIIRNVLNITFIFVLLFTALKTIIGASDANTKKTLANVIIAALLINFSLFFTRIFIDAGNILATALYNYVTETKTISEAVAGTLGLGSIFATTGIDCTACTPFFVATALQTFVMLSAIIVLTYITMLMLARTILLIFLMVLSPIGFMGDVIPKISEYAKMWRENLYGQVMIAPIFLLFLYLIVQISGNLKPDNLTGDNAAYTVYFKFVLIIVLLFAAVKVTKKLAGAAGSIMEKVGMVAAGAAIGYATGGASLLATKTLGAGAERIKNSKFGDRLKNSDNIMARVAMRNLDKTSKATFDMRNTETFKKTTGLIGEHTGLKVDYDRGIKIKKDGFQGAVERNAKEDEEYAKLVTKDMPEITDDHVKAERVKIDDDIQDKDREIADLYTLTNSDPSLMTQENIDKMDRLNSEKEKMENRKKLDNSKLKKELEKDAKNARLDKQAKAAEKGIYNWMVGGGIVPGAGKIARKAAADKVRKLKGEKSSKDQLRDLTKKFKEEEEAEEAKPAKPATPPPAAAPAAAPGAGPGTPP